MRLFLLLIIPFSIISCNSLKKKILGFENPKLEDFKSVRNYAKDNFGEENDVWVFNEIEEMAGGLSQSFFIPDARFYNQEGYFVNYKKSPEECNAKIGTFMKEFNALSTTNDSTDLVSNFSGKLINTRTKELFTIDNFDKNLDGYIFIFWAKYIGKLNKSKTLNWINAYRNIKNSGNNFQLILVNADFLEEWGLTQMEIDKMLNVEIN